MLFIREKIESFFVQCEDDKKCIKKNRCIFEMKKILSFSSIGLACIVLLTALLLQTVKMNSRLQDMARPSKLFSPSLIETDIPHRDDWEVNLSQDHHSFFYTVSQQPLYWIGKGMQVVVFQTQDEKYVVKFFQMNRLRNPVSKSFLKKLFHVEAAEHEKNRISHREELFFSSKFCFEELSEETGIVYVHLNRTQDRLYGVKLIDKFGQSHRIRADNASFVVQKKGTYIVPTLTHLMDTNKIDEAKARIDQIISLLQSLAEKGYVDGDDALIRNNNMGFTEDRAIYIDTGHLHKQENMNVYGRMLYEFQIRLEPLQKWLNVAYPELGEYYSLRREQVLTSLKGQQTH